MGAPSPSALPAGPVVTGAVPAWRRNWAAWCATPLRARMYVVAVVTCAAVVTGWGVPGVAAHGGAVVLFVLFAVGSMVNIELGRWLEGSLLERDRTHKGMSAWPFTAALLMPMGAAGCIALVAYAHMRARGIRITLWKWVFSWAAVTLSAAAATGAMDLAGGGPLSPTGSGRTVLGTALAVAAFLAVEAAAFFGISRLNTAGEEVQLRRALAHPDFYVTEAVVLASAAIAAMLVRYSPWAILFTLPGHVQVQRAVIYRALREEARTDRKTGLLNCEVWRSDAAVYWKRARRGGQGLAVLLADLDHFKAVNDAHGHLVGDEVLAATARAMVEPVRKSDLVGRFGGEEFCLLLHDVSPAEARAVAERLRQGVGSLAFGPEGLRVTVSVGLAVADWSRPDQTLSELIATADKRLYEAKSDGRDRVCG
jgi:diguanylate cyclase (GGDEF)-like protein